MKNLNNIGKPVPEASDPPLIKPVSDAIEAIDTLLGAPASSLATAQKTIVPAVNELKSDIGDVAELDTDANTVVTAVNEINANISLLKNSESLFTGNIAPGGTATLLSAAYEILVIVTSNEAGESSRLAHALFFTKASLGYLAIYFGTTATYIRIQISGKTLSFLTSGDAAVRIKGVYGLIPK